MVKIKHKDFIGAVPIKLCLNSSWIMDLSMYGEGRTQIPPSSSATIGLLPKVSIDRLYWSLTKNLSKQMNSGESGFSLLHRSYLHWYKIAKNTKINHIMVSFTNHYNAIIMDRLPSKTKTGKCSWYFNNSLICKSEVS